MSFFKPEKSKKKYYIFGKGGGKKLSKGYEMELLSEIPLLEKKEFIILYDIETYKKAFDSIAKKVVKNMEAIKKTVTQVIPQKQDE